MARLHQGDARGEWQVIASCMVHGRLQEHVYSVTALVRGNQITVIVIVVVVIVIVVCFSI